MRHPAQWKVELVKEMASEFSSSPVTALVSIKGIRNSQLQKIRRDLKGDAKIRVVRRRLLLKALEQARCPPSFTQYWKAKSRKLPPEVER